MTDTAKSRAIMAKRTKEKWQYEYVQEGHGGYGIEDVCWIDGDAAEEDVEAIVHAVNNAEAWVDEIERLRAEVERLSASREAVFQKGRELLWKEQDARKVCPHVCATCMMFEQDWVGCD